MEIGLLHSFVQFEPLFMCGETWIVPLQINDIIFMSLSAISGMRNVRLLLLYDPKLIQEKKKKPSYRKSNNNKK